MTVIINLPSFVSNKAAYLRRQVTMTSNIPTSRKTSLNKGWNWRIRWRVLKQSTVQEAELREKRKIMIIIHVYFHNLHKKCSFRTVQNLLVRFDENTDTNQLFVWNKVQVKNNKLQDLKELFLQKKEHVINILKNIPNIRNNIFIFFLNMHVNKLKFGFKHVSY